MNNYKTPYYLIIGLGRSGLSMARFMHSKGFNIKATDIDSSRAKEAQILESMNIETHIGYHDPKALRYAKALIVSPGVPLDMPYIQEAVAQGIPVTGELDIFTLYNDTPIVAVTGTNGKTTTTVLISAMLKSSGLNIFTGGNIGTPLVDYLMLDKKADIVVAEISSFQLDLSEKFCPDVALFLNLTYDHLDRYSNFNAYGDAKWSIFKNQTDNHYAIINRSIHNFEARIRDIKANIIEINKVIDDYKILRDITASAIVFPDKVKFFLPSLPKITNNEYEIDCKNLNQLRGAHNRENLAGGVLASLCAGGNFKGIESALMNFKNLDHRISFVREIKGIRFYNDSKATNIDAVIKALETFDKNDGICRNYKEYKNVILILGGRSKKVDFSILLPGVKKRVRHIIAIGETGEMIMEVFGQNCPTTLVQSMDQAAKQSFQLAVPGDIVLLSPACASFDMYANYKDRGNDFIKRVNALT